MAELVKRLQTENVVLAKRVERQMALIAEIAAFAKINPSVMDVLERVKMKVTKNS